jgi:hypothetical protein
VAVRVLLAVAAFTVLYGCAQASSPDEEQTAEEKESEYTPSPAPTDYVNPTASATADPLKYGDEMEIDGIPWSVPYPVEYDGRKCVYVIFKFTDGSGNLFMGVTSTYNTKAAKELRAAGKDSRQAKPPEYLLQGTYEDIVKMDDGTKYEAIWVESAERVQSN